MSSQSPLMRHDYCELDHLSTVTNLKSVIIVLNQPIPISTRPFFDALWSKSLYRIVADGAANYLPNLDSVDDGKKDEGEGDHQSLHPDVVVGDMDSVTSTTVNSLITHGVPTIHIPDQDTTDLDKCLSLFHALQREAIEEIKSRNLSMTLLPAETTTSSSLSPSLPLSSPFQAPLATLTFTSKAYPSLSSIPLSIAYAETIYCLGACGGRFDHTMAAIQSLYIYHSLHPTCLQPPPPSSPPSTTAPSDFTSQTSFTTGSIHMTSSSPDPSPTHSSSHSHPTPRVILLGDGNAIELFTPGRHLLIPSYHNHRTYDLPST